MLWVVQSSYTPVVQSALLNHVLQEWSALRVHHVLQQCTVVRKNCQTFQGFVKNFTSFTHSNATMAHCCVNIYGIAEISHNNVPLQSMAASVAPVARKDGWWPPQLLSLYNKWCARGVSHANVVLNVRRTLVHDSTGDDQPFTPRPPVGLFV